MRKGLQHLSLPVFFQNHLRLPTRFVTTQRTHEGQIVTCLASAPADAAGGLNHPTASRPSGRSRFGDGWKTDHFPPDTIWGLLAPGDQFAVDLSGRHANLSPGKCL